MVKLQHMGMIALVIAVLFGTSSHSMAQDTSIGASGQPIPRFVAIAADSANLRTGPGTQYPVQFEFKRPGLPVKVIGERGVWRQVEDMDGDIGWMHVSLLTGKRRAMVVGAAKLRFKLYKKANSLSDVRLTMDAGVIGELEGCTRLWCAITVTGITGFIERRHLWGVFSHEETL